MEKKVEVSSQMTKEDSEPKTGTQKRNYESIAKALRRKKASVSFYNGLIRFEFLFARIAAPSKKRRKKSCRLSLPSLKLSLRHNPLKR